MYRKFKIISSVMTLLFLPSCISNNKKDVYIGKKINVYFFEINNNIDNAFELNKIYSSNLYNIVVNDAVEINTNKSAKNKIKNASKILINVGIDEILNCFFVKNNEVYMIEEEKISRALELYEYRMHRTLEEINEINSKAKIYLFENYYFGDDKIISLAQKYNEILMDFNDKYDYVYYIDCTKINVTSNSLTNKDCERLIDIIYD